MSNCLHKTIFERFFEKKRNHYLTSNFLERKHPAIYSAALIPENTGLAVC